MMRVGCGCGEGSTGEGGLWRVVVVERVSGEGGELNNFPQK